MQKNEGVLFLFKRDRFEEIFGWHWYVCLKKNKHQHIAFKIRIWDNDSFGKLIHFISDKWEKRKVFFEKYKIIYPWLISFLKWKFDYVFFENKTKNEKPNLRKSLQQNSRCCAWDIYKKILFRQDFAVEERPHIYYCQKKERETFWSGKKQTS